MITINAVSLTTTCIASGATSAAIVNNQDIDVHPMPNDTSTLYRNVVQRLQDLCNEVRVSDAITKKVCYVVFNKREVVFYQSTKGRGRSPRPFVL